MKKSSGAGPQVHGRAGAAQEKHSVQSTSRVHAQQREDASKSAAPQNRRMVRSGAGSRVQFRAIRSEPDQRAFRGAPS